MYWTWLESAIWKCKRKACTVLFCESELELKYNAQCFHASVFCPVAEWLWRNTLLSVKDVVTVTLSLDVYLCASTAAACLNDQRSWTFLASRLVSFLTHSLRTRVDIYGISVSEPLELMYTVNCASSNRKNVELRWRAGRTFACIDNIGCYNNDTNV